MRKLLAFTAFVLLTSHAYGATLGASSSAPDPSSSFSATTGLFSSTSGAVSVTSAGTEIMRINGTGVGIGTASFGLPLTAYSTSNNVAIFGNRTTTLNSLHVVDIVSPTPGTPLTVTGGSGNIEFWKDTSPSKANAIGGAVPGNTPNGDLVFSKFNGSSWSEALRIQNSTGDLAIGASTPINKLDVAGSAAIGAGYAGANIAPTNGLIIQGVVGIGTSVPTIGSTLDLSYNIDSMLLPVGTTGQRPTGVDGMVRYNLTTPAVEAFVNGSWVSLNGGGGETLHEQTFTSSGTFTAPAGTVSTTVFKLTITGGGASAGPSGCFSQPAGPGPSGGTCVAYVSGLTAATGYTVTVGAGGFDGAHNCSASGSDSSVVIGANTYAGGAGLMPTGGSAAEGTTSNNCSISLHGSLGWQLSTGTHGGDSNWGEGLFNSNGNPGGHYGAGSGSGLVPGNDGVVTVEWVL